MDVTYQCLIRQRVISCAKAFQAIDEARTTLSQLEVFAMQTSNGDLPDVEKIARTVHVLRNKADEILVGLVEARTVPEDKQ